MIIACFLASNSFGQDLGSPVKYEARDSIVANIPKQIITLYGQAKVNFDDFELTADFIQIDLINSEVLATFTLDSAGAPVGKPVFITEGQETRSDYIKYNFETKKGYVREVRTQQGEGYIHMAESKIHPNEQIHLHDGKFTTCDADTPHYHFKLTKAIIVPDERIVTGPVYMKLFKIPLPLAAPFGFFPNSDTKKHGIIIPRFANTNEYGFGLQDFGYYIPLGDYWETYFYATLFTSGRFGLQNISNYYRKYRYEGTIGLKFEQFRGKFYDPDISNKWTFNWRHTQDAKAHPTIKFSSDINFVSDNNAKTTLAAINPDYFNNQFNSAINLTKRWKAGNFAGTMGLKTSLQQNSQSNNYTVELPTFNLSLNQFDLGVLRKEKIGRKWYENIKVSYSLNARNFISAPDSIFNDQYLYLVNDYVLNGVQQNAVVQSNLRILGGRITFSPVVNYTEFWNFQYEKNTWNPGTEKIDTVELNGFKSSRTMSISAGLNSNFFGYYKMGGKKQMKFRHVASPNIGFSFRPNIGIYDSVQYDTLGNSLYYSPFQTSLFKEAGYGTSGTIQFGISNTLEMKVRDRKDTLNDSFKNYKLIDAFSINGGYDIFKDTSKLSNINFSFRTARFLKVFSFQSGALLSPYHYDPLTGLESKEYAWNSSQGIGRFRTATTAITANFTNKNGRAAQNEMNEKTKNDAKQNGMVTSPGFTTMKIPWQINLSYNFNLTQGPVKISSGYVDSIRLIQTIRLDGDFNLGENWKFTYGVNYDLQADNVCDAISTYNFTIWRNLHCWEAALTWFQYGPWVGKETNINFLFRVNIKASMFQDIKLEYTQPPTIFF
ncbi:MAG: LPS-assembly protein LptD [Crocinitomicaceae bacterium]|nr:LPS-assembly protein LptD [Crocinitomicaceae bacterium]